MATGSGLNIGSNEASEAFGPVEEDDEDVFGASPFIGDDDLLDDDKPFELDRDVFGFDEDDVMSSAGPFSTSPFSASVDSAVSETPPARPTPGPSSSLSPNPMPSTAPVRNEGRSVLSGFEEDEDDFEDDLLDNDYDDADLGAVDPSEFFKFIPAEIRATRLPGTNERYPVLAILGVLLLLVMNIGGIALVYMTLTGSV